MTNSPAWQTGAASSDDIVRRYNQNPFLLRDEHYGKTAKPDIFNLIAFMNCFAAGWVP